MTKEQLIRAMDMESPSDVPTVVIDRVSGAAYNICEVRYEKPNSDAEGVLWLRVESV